MALPPFRRISRPASAASGSLVATMPWRASTSERPCPSQPCAREPGTAWMPAAGCGLSADGCPNGFGDCALPAIAESTTANPIAPRPTRCWPGIRCRRVIRVRHQPGRHRGDDGHACGKGQSIPSVTTRHSVVRARGNHAGPPIEAPILRLVRATPRREPERHPCRGRSVTTKSGSMRASGARPRSKRCRIRPRMVCISSIANDTPTHPRGPAPNARWAWRSRSRPAGPSNRHGSNSIGLWP